MIGVSLLFEMLSGETLLDPAYQALLAAYDGDLEQLLGSLRAQGVGSVEFNVRRENMDPEAVARAARQCTDAGLGVTIHGQLRDGEAPADFCRPYEALPSQERYTITLHGLEDMDATVSALRALATYADDHMPHLFFALENNRRRANGGACQSCALAALALSLVDHPRVSACWDFGHFYGNVMNSAESGLLPGQLPPEGFSARVVHTHIHGVTGGRTHFPLDGTNLPLERYCALLSRQSYPGTYHLELGFGRFYPHIEPRQALEDSIKILRGVVA